MIVRSSEIHCKEKLSEILNGFDSCDQDRTFYILSALHRILPEEDFDIHVWRDDGYDHLDDGEMTVTKAEDLLHNGFEVDISHCIRFAPCGFHIDNPNNRFVFADGIQTNWIAMDDYEEDDRFAVQMTEDFCEGRLCTATAVYGEMPECSPQIVISGKSIEKLTFDEVLSCFELKMPSGFPLCKENISKIKVSFWEKKLDYCLTK